MESPLRAYPTKWEWGWDWDERFSRQRVKNRGGLSEIAAYLANDLRSRGFQLFENGGTPLFLRYYEDLREEILLVPAPRFWSRPDMPFTATVYLSSPEIGETRSRFWRPACRAPHVIASGNIGCLEDPPVHYIFEASAGLRCAAGVSRLITQNVLPWLELFHDPDDLRDRIDHNDLPLIDESTSVELLLSRFGRPAARRYVKRYREMHVESPKSAIHELEGYDLATSRINPISAYYKLEVF